MPIRCRRNGMAKHIVLAKILRLFMNFTFVEVYAISVTMVVEVLQGLISMDYGIVLGFLPGSVLCLL